MLKRKIEGVLSAWKRRPNHMPLVIKGCRQCGKTYSVLSFAQRHYEHVIYIDFHQNSEYCSMFDGSLLVDTLVMNISATIPNAKFVPRKTCIVFDEIQDCPRARASLKFFKLDGRYDVICTGSLLGVNGYNTTESSIPVGYEQIIDMYPLDFEEWLWANGIKPQVFDYLKQSLVNETPINTAVQNRMRDLLLQYVVVGGMPAAVEQFLQTHNMGEVLQLQRAIVDEYKSDMIKYAGSADKAQIRECFESIPRQLSREYKKFTYSQVRKGARSKDYVGSLQWIEDASIIRRCHNVRTPELPLIGNAIPDEFKVYMADTGLFVSMLDDGTQADILRGNLYGYSGAIFENLIADMLGKSGQKLYYYHKDGGLELDFLIRYHGDCTPVECKATTGNAKSLKTVLQHREKYHISQAIKVGDYNIGRMNGVLTIPHFLVFLLRDEQNV